MNRPPMYVKNKHCVSVQFPEFASIFFASQCLWVWPAFSVNVDKWPQGNGMMADECYQWLVGNVLPTNPLVIMASGHVMIYVGYTQY